MSNEMGPTATEIKKLIERPHEGLQTKNTMAIIRLANIIDEILDEKAGKEKED